MPRQALVRDLKDKQDRLWTARARLSVHSILALASQAAPPSCLPQAFRCEKEAADCKRAPLLPSPSAGADWQSLQIQFNLAQPLR